MQNLKNAARLRARGCSYQKQGDILDNLERNKKTKSELRRLSKLFGDLDDSTRGIVKPLIENAAFMSVSLDELQNIIREKGFSETYQNGENQFGTKKTVEVDIYNTMIKNYASVIKQLCDLSPTAQPEQDGKLFTYLAGNKK